MTPALPIESLSDITEGTPLDDPNVGYGPMEKFLRKIETAVNTRDFKSQEVCLDIGYLVEAYRKLRSAKSFMPVEVHMPDGDPRTVRVQWTEVTDGKIHVCITVGERPTVESPDVEKLKVLLSAGRVLAETLQMSTVFTSDYWRKARHNALDTWEEACRAATKTELK